MDLRTLFKTSKTFTSTPGLTRALAVLVVFACTPTSAMEQTVYEFDILRNGSPVGQHELRISRLDGETRVFALSHIEVTLLGFTVYRMRYRAEEIWDRQGLKALDVDVDDDGEPRRLDGRRQGTRFLWVTADGTERSNPLPVFPTNHWNPSVLRASMVLNTLTGQSNRIEVETDRTEPALPLPAPATGVPVAYRYQGDLNLHSWYDRQGRWLGMRFEGRDGSNIEYVCRNCADTVAL